MRHRETELGNQVFCGWLRKKGGIIAKRWIESQPMVEFEFKAYRRSFSDEYRTVSDSMLTRSGIILQITDKEGRIGFGEVAPIESFGTETFVSAVSMCSQLEGKIEYERVVTGLMEYPCLRFGLESAFQWIRSEDPWPVFSESIPICGLLPNLGDRERLDQLLADGFTHVKTKIGKEPFSQERRCLEYIIDRTGGGFKLRLDANGGLELRTAREWLESVSELPVEFIEQPMAKGEEATMLELAKDFPIPIALDESAVSVDDLKRWKDRHWPGLFVIKPSLSGSCQELREELQDWDPQTLVFSSSLETMIGTANALMVAIEVGKGSRALGFGVDRLFIDDGFSLRLGSRLDQSGLPVQEEFESLWNRI